MSLFLIDNTFDNPTAVIVPDDFSIANLSLDAESGLEFLLLENLLYEFGNQTPSLDVFEPAQVSQTSALTTADEGHLWTVNSVALETEIVSTEPDEKSFFEDVFSGADEDGLDYIVDTNAFDEDVWM